MDKPTELLYELTGAREVQRAIDALPDNPAAWVAARKVVEDLRQRLSEARAATRPDIEKRVWQAGLVIPVDNPGASVPVSPERRPSQIQFRSVGPTSP